MRKTAILAAIAGIGFLGFALSGCNQADAGDRERVTPVKAATVREQPAYTITRRYTGHLQAGQRSRLGFELGGELAMLAVDEGDTVGRGDLLARLDTERLEAALARAQAGRREAAASLSLAEQTLARTENARAADAVSAQSLDQARQRMEAARAALDSIDADIASIKVDLRKSALRAPYDGRVLRRFIDDGSVVGPATAVFELISLDGWELRVGLPQMIMDSLAEGDTFRVETATEPVTATYLRLIPSRNLRTRTIEGVFAVNGDGRRLIDDDLVTIAISLPVEVSNFEVPRSALTAMERGLWAVYVIAERSGTQRVERKIVELLHFEEERVNVRGALETGMQIVTDGTHKLTEGQNVSITTGG